MSEKIPETEGGNLADVISFADKKEKILEKRKAEALELEEAEKIPEEKEPEKVVGTLSVLYEKYDDLLDEMHGIVDYFDMGIAGDEIDREETLKKIQKEQIKRLKALQEHTLNKFKSPTKQAELEQAVQDVNDLEDQFIERHNMFDQVTELIQEGVDRLVKLVGSTDAQTMLVQMGLDEQYVENIVLGDEEDQKE